MSNATLVHLMGVTFLVTGMLMIVFRQSLGVAFCRFGRWTFQAFSHPWIRQHLDEVYDERRAPRHFLMLGVVNVIQSPVFFTIGYLL